MAASRLTMPVGRVVALWLIAIGLGWWDRHEAAIEEPQAEAESATATVRAPLLSTAEVDVMTVRVVDGPYRIVFARGGAGWILREPADALVPHDLLRAFVESLTDAVTLDVVPDEPSGVGFGFDESRRVEVVGSDGRTESILIGGQTPTGTAAYVRDGAGTVHVIGRNALVYRELILKAARPKGDAHPANDAGAG